MKGRGFPDASWVLDLGSVTVDVNGVVTDARVKAPVESIQVPVAVHVEVDGRRVPAWLEARA